MKHVGEQHIEPAARESFVLEFLSQIEVGEHWPWNILWTDEAHLNVDVNTHNSRIWAKQILHVIYPVPLHSPKATAWCSMAVNFIIGSLFFKEQ